MRVTEQEHEVNEKEVDVYICDRCGDEMGEEPDNVIHANPRIKMTKHYGSAASPPSQRHKRTKTVKVGDNFSRGPGHGDPDQVDAIVEDKMEWCDSCVNKVFYPSRLQQSVAKLIRMDDETLETIVMTGIIGVATLVVVLLILL